MECFIVDGRKTNLSDVIAKYITTGEECLIATYGFGVNQVLKLVNLFANVTMVADVSHAQLNDAAYKSVVSMAESLHNFKFIPIKNHAKFAIIDNHTVIFTSANLSSNQKLESYVVCCKSELCGIEDMAKVFSDEGVKFKGHNDKYKLVKGDIIKTGGLNEPRYTHEIDKHGNCFKPG